jgi:thiamine biosynthesis lipoprotein
MKKILITFFIILIIIISFVSCNKADENFIKENFFALDTFINITVSEGEGARAGLDAAIKRIQEIEERMSATLPGSDVYRINENAGKRPVTVESDTFYVIQKAIEFGELTKGALDISTRSLSLLWDITGENPRVPEEEEIRMILPLVDYRKIHLDEEKRTVFLEQEGMAIDLGSIAKGYAGDEAVRILKEHGIASGLINLGGNIVVIGSKEDGSPWRIGIQNPRMDESKDGQRRHVAVVEAVDKSVITSGDYERYMVEIYEKTGERYHHIFDPSTGYPAKSGVISVTVVSESGIDADAWTTSLFVMGVEEGLKLINELESVDAMFITEDKKIYFSKGFKDQVSDIHGDYHAE